MTYPKMRPASGGTNAERPWKEKKKKEKRQGQSDLMLPRMVGDQSRRRGCCMYLRKRCLGGGAGLSDDRAWWWLEDGDNRPLKCQQVDG